MNSKLFAEVIKRVKRMRGIEVFIVFAVRTLHFAVVTGRKGTDLLVLDLSLFQGFLKKGLIVCL